MKRPGVLDILGVLWYTVGVWFREGEERDMLKVQEFIRANSDWECLLSSEPYCISISEDCVNGRDLVLLKYDQLNSDLGNAIVQECRGLILDAHTYEVVSYPFNKFFNFGESHAADIDWRTAKVTSKKDGSIIKVVNLDGQFLISTNGVIDAFKCNLPENVGCPFNSFGELVMEGFKFYGIKAEDFPRLFKPGFTYIFELTSPWNQVVVKWEETKVWLIGIRDNRTFKEVFYGDSELADIFDTPEIYPITNIDECVEAAKVLPEDAEGYVVVDAQFNRIKVKSPRYIQLHYMAGNQVWSPTRVLEILRANEVAEYVVYFPQFKAAFDVVKAKYDAYVGELEDLKDAIDNLLEVENGSMPKKDFAKWVFVHPEIKLYSGFAFSYFDSVYAKTKEGNAVVRSAQEYVDKMRTSQLVDALGL